MTLQLNKADEPLGVETKVKDFKCCNMQCTHQKHMWATQFNIAWWWLCESVWTYEAMVEPKTQQIILTTMQYNRRHIQRIAGSSSTNNKCTVIWIHLALEWQELRRVLDAYNVFKTTNDEILLRHTRCLEDESNWSESSTWTSIDHRDYWDCSESTRV